MSPVVAAVVDPLLHHGVVRVQVDGHVLLLRVQHVAELLQAAVLRAAAGGVAQVVHDVRHVHLPCNATVVSGGFACDVSCLSIRFARGAVPALPLACMGNLTSFVEFKISSNCTRTSSVSFPLLLSK